MEVVVEVGAGLDVHKQRIVVCCLDGRSSPPTVIKCTFGTFRDELERMRDWLLKRECTHVAMESTGVFVRRFTARAIPPAGRTGSEGYLWANDSPGGESPRGPQHAVEAGTPEDVYGAAPRDPHDRAKAGWLESQSPAVTTRPSLPRLLRGPRDTRFRQTTSEASPRRSGHPCGG